MTETRRRKATNEPKESSEKPVTAEEEINIELVKLTELVEQVEGVDDLISPLFSFVSTLVWKERLRKLSILAGVLAALYCVAFIPFVTELLSYIFRRYLIKARRYWEWTELYYSDCLLPNPYYIGNQLLEEDCSVCESLDGLTRLANASHADITQQYLQNDIPFIVTDGIKENEKLKFHNLTELYLSDNLKDVPPCSMLTNLRSRKNQLRGVLNKIQTHQPLHWFIHWENCNKRAAKALRSLYHRPYFLPPMVDLSDSNWVLMSSNYNGKVFREVGGRRQDKEQMEKLKDMLKESQKSLEGQFMLEKWSDSVLPSVTSVLVLAQIRGFNNIRLTPREPCEGLCHTIEDTLAEGEILVFTDFLWKYEYMPGASSDNIAIAIGGFWD